ncbi:electron transport complex subunit RsxE [Lentisalinibacter sediminis]|uniref:electron transport complex subunit RsxE n=1 Tax=Lentisalinibacter sediminis TaxID=2992237 RepID=UPI00386BCA33
MSQTDATTVGQESNPTGETAAVPAAGRGRWLRNGLWDNNPGLVQLLGLCPLLAVTTGAVHGLGLGLATVFVMTATNALVSLLRRSLTREIRIAVYVLIIASLVTCVEMIFEAWFPALDRALGIFIALIVTNCAIVARAEAVASRQPPLPAAADGLVMGLGFAWVLVVVGGIRELVGRGTLFADWHLLTGAVAAPADQAGAGGGFLLAILPPGAFLTLALLIAGKNLLDSRRQQPAASALRSADGVE